MVESILNFVCFSTYNGNLTNEIMILPAKIGTLKYTNKSDIVLKKRFRHLGPWFTYTDVYEVA